jgi:membrane-associated phospholipid phosphatase
MLKTYLYDWGGANEALFHFINNWRGGFLDRFMWLGTLLGDHRNFPYYATAIALAGFFGGMRERSGYERAEDVVALRWLAVLAMFCVAYLLDGLFLTIVKNGLDYPRPLVALGAAAVHVVGTPELHRGFPSGHASFAVTFVASLWPVLGRVPRGMGLAFIGWVAVSRVNVGAHFPADVLAGMASAWVIVLAVRWALLELGNRAQRS